MTEVLRLDHIQKTYTSSQGTLLEILKDIHFVGKKGEIIALVGASGVGKSTLLHIMGLLDHPTAGVLCLNGQEIHNLSEKKRTLLRRNTLGFIYQHHHLQPEFSALENVIKDRFSR